MRCTCCNKVLNDFEATRRGAISGDFLDTCNKCIKGLGIKTIDREDFDSKLVEDEEYLEEDHNYSEEFLGIPKHHRWDDDGEVR